MKKSSYYADHGKFLLCPKYLQEYISTIVFFSDENCSKRPSDQHDAPSSVPPPPPDTEYNQGIAENRSDEEDEEQSIESDDDFSVSSSHFSTDSELDEDDAAKSLSDDLLDLTGPPKGSHVTLLLVLFDAVCCRFLIFC